MLARRARALARAIACAVALIGPVVGTAATGQAQSPAWLAPALRVPDSLARADTLLAISVSVAHAGRVLWEGGLGLADRTTGRAASASTVYRVASVAKSITAVAALQLVERGALDLEAPVSRYLGPSRARTPVGDPRALTVRTLLAMTGGVPHLVHFGWADGAPARGDGELVRTYGVTAFAPGRRFHYSNLSYGMLAEVIASAAAQSFGTVVQQQLFDPLAMRESALRRTTSTAPLEAVGYLDAHPLSDGEL
ncbi:MAG: beta-lactamase family protein, partial [Gemmatimonadetes bacterium]|nr:beta-lactamase family protein [Gemmatimonadota bacterium]